MDHFIVSTPGRLFTSRGSEAHDRRFKGGVIFVDHATGFTFVEPVVNFTAGEAIRAKREFEAEMSSMGVTVLNYHTDNGVFTATQFQDELATMQQGLTLSGVGAHHQNAVAERAIGTVTSIARTMMLHAKMRWPSAVKTMLWPMAMKHAQFLVNNVPTLNNICPMDLVLGTVVPRHHLRQVHVWGSPCFVLDPKLQDGHKIPKFDPRSRQGLNLGWSPKHASSVPLVLNLSTGTISPQFHVVFDDWFSTVSSITSREEPEPIDGETWTNLLMNDRIQVAFDEDDPVEVNDEWLTEIERLEKHQKAVARVQGNLPAPPSLAPPSIGQEAATPPPIQGTLPQVPSVPQSVPPIPIQRETPPPVHVPQQPQAPVPPPQREQRERPLRQVPASDRRAEIDQINVLPPGLKRGRRAVKGLLCSVLLAASNTPVVALARQCIGSPQAHLGMAGLDAVTHTFDQVDFHSFRAMTTPVKKMKKGKDPDFPTLQQVLVSPDVDEWKESMAKEINTLVKMNTALASKPSSSDANRVASPTAWAVA